MKKILFIFFITLVFEKINAQVVFCPPGAEWHYLFGTPFNTGNTNNEQIKYVGDSISGPDTLKILEHYEFIPCRPPVRKTYVRQKGDTVFFKNSFTWGTWQILYNFAALPGQGWQTVLLNNSTTSLTFTFTVDSVYSVTINGFNLKRLAIHTTNGWGNVTERFGSNTFLFNFRTPNGCDAPGFQEFLCYQDSTFGIKQFGNNSCAYYSTNSVGIHEETITGTHIKIYPNPTNNLLNIETDAPEQTEIKFIDISGKEIKRVNITHNERIDLTDLNRGIYFIIAATKTGPIYSTKLIKD